MLEGKAVLRVVNVEPPTATAVAAPPTASALSAPSSWGNGSEICRFDRKCIPFVFFVGSLKYSCPCIFELEYRSREYKREDSKHDF